MPLSIIKQQFLIVIIRINFILLALSCKATCSRQVRAAYIGCYTDCGGYARDLDGLSGIGQIGSLPLHNAWSGSGAYNPGMSIELCASICSLGGFRYMGLQATFACFCGNSYGLQGAAASAASSCVLGCAGNASQVCGGYCYNSIYSLEYLEPNLLVKSNLTFLTFYQNMTYAIPTFWSVSAIRSDIECVLLCLSDCQAVIYAPAPLRGICCMLRFAAVPPALVADAAAAGSVFFVRA